MPQPPNLQKMLQQAQEMMAAQQEAQEALKEERVDVSAGGGMVKVTASGDGRIEAITIDPDAVDPEDVEMLQDLVLAAVNQALSQVAAIVEQKMGSVAGPDFDPMSALDSLGLGGGGMPGGLPGGPGAAGGAGNRAARRAQKKHR